MVSIIEKLVIGYIKRIIKSHILCENRKSYYIDLRTKKVKYFFASENDQYIGVNDESWEVSTFYKSYNKKNVLSTLENFLNSEIILRYNESELWPSFDFIIAASEKYTPVSFILPHNNKWGNIFDRYCITHVKSQGSMPEFDAIKNYFKLYTKLNDKSYFITKINELPKNIFKIISSFNPTLNGGELFEKEPTTFIIKGKDGLNNKI